MAHLIVCIGKDQSAWDDVSKILSSGLFDRIYVVMGLDVHNYQKPHTKEGVIVNIVRLDISKPSEEIVPELYVILKKHFTSDKVQDLDMAVNISSGTGKEHAVVISTLMKLGYGIRLVDLDKDGNILEML